MMATLHDYRQVGANCSHFRKQYDPMDGIYDGIDERDSCTVCEHFDERRGRCRLDLYDKLRSGLTAYYLD